MAVVIREIVETMEDCGFDLGTRKGSDDSPYYTVFCPFHDNTRTPAMVVYPKINKCQCKGACNRYWSPEEFYAQLNNVPIEEARRALEERIDPIVLALREIEKQAEANQSSAQLQIVASLNRALTLSGRLGFKDMILLQKRVDAALRAQDYLAAKHLIRVASRNAV